MAFRVVIVENDKGRRRVHPGGVAALLVFCVVACMLIPALGTWLIFGDAKLATTTLVIGFVNAFTSFGLILGMQYRRSLKTLPQRPGDPDF